jgi:hypothetical protein
MPRRKVELDVKVAVMRESLRLINVADAAHKHQLTEQAVYNWYNKILEALPDILADEKPGPKPKAKSEATPPF